MFLNNVSINYSLVLSILLLFTILHFAFSVLLMIGIRIYRRELLLPWLVTHLIIIIVKIIIFSFCTFITFFIDILVSIVFPVASGMVLGISLLLWRLVWAAYSNNLIRKLKIKGFLFEPNQSCIKHFFWLLTNESVYFWSKILNHAHPLLILNKNFSEEKKTDCDKDDNCFKMRSALKTLTKLIA